MARDFVEEIRRRSQQGADQRRSRAGQQAGGYPPNFPDRPSSPGRSQRQLGPPATSSSRPRGPVGNPPPLPQDARASGKKAKIGCTVLVVAVVVMIGAIMGISALLGKPVELGPLLFVGIVLLVMLSGKFSSKKI